MFAVIYVMWQLAKARRIENVKEQLESVKKAIPSMDQNARAYGYEIGRGQQIGNVINGVVGDNPFLDENWRDQIKD